MALGERVVVVDDGYRVICECVVGGSGWIAARLR
jgi:hypothetical protein